MKSQREKEKQQKDHWNNMRKKGNDIQDSTSGNMCHQSGSNQDGSSSTSRHKVGVATQFTSAASPLGAHRSRIGWPQKKAGST